LGLFSGAVAELCPAEPNAGPTEALQLRGADAERRQQGPAAQFVLRRRGVSSVLYYDAAPDEENGPSAHVWVREGHVDVIGSEIAAVDGASSAHGI